MTGPADRPRFDYARCPTCDGVTPHGYANWPPGQSMALPVEAACLACGTWTTFTDRADLATELDATAVHQPCGTPVPCPSAAKVVRCPAASHIPHPEATEEERVAARLFPGATQASP